jgi:hypothetical protein
MMENHHGLRMIFVLLSLDGFVTVCCAGRTSRRGHTPASHMLRGHGGELLKGTQKVFTNTPISLGVLGQSGSCSSSIA